jgi:general secretion pathway protein D
MKLSGALALCVLAALPVASSAQESSKAAVARYDIDMVELITRFAKRTGKQFVIDPRVRAQVPLAGIDPGQITHEQLLAILDVHQYAVVESGGMLAVVPDANARQLPTPVHTDKGFKALDYELVTLLVQPKNVCAAFMVPVLRPLMPQAAHLAAEIQTNSLIITDHAVNARRIAEMVEQLDKRGSGKKDCPAAGASMSAPVSSPTAAPAKPG